MEKMILEASEMEELHSKGILIARDYKLIETVRDLEGEVIAWKYKSKDGNVEVTILND